MQIKQYFILTILIVLPLLCLGQKVWVVAVGISQYRSSGLDDLETPLNKVYEFADLFNRRGVLDERILRPLTNRKADYDGIISKLESEFVYNPNVGTEDLVIFYFSGHGITTENQKSQGKEAGICPYDYHRPSDYIPESEIRAIMDSSKAKHKICIIEACKTEVTLGHALSAKNKKSIRTRREALPPNWIYWTSSELGKPSYELIEEGAVFSYYLLKGLEGEANFDNDNIITIEELFIYVNSMLPLATADKKFPQKSEINGQYNKNLPIMGIPQQEQEKPRLNIYVEYSCQLFLDDKYQGTFNPYETMVISDVFDGDHILVTKIKGKEVERRKFNVSYGNRSQDIGFTKNEHGI